MAGNGAALTSPPPAPLIVPPRVGVRTTTLPGCEPGEAEVLPLNARPVCVKTLPIRRSSHWTAGPRVIIIHSSEHNRSQNIQPAGNDAVRRDGAASREPEMSHARDGAAEGQSG